jgi:hypothetical protein
MGCKRVVSVWSASEGATPGLNNFPNMSYIVGHVVLASAITYYSNQEKWMFEN